jgi:hypothetical protein
MPDETFVCCNCRQPFVWSEGEQKWLVDNGFKHPPRRCRKCRASKGATRVAAGERKQKRREDALAEQTRAALENQRRLEAERARR